MNLSVMMPFNVNGHEHNKNSIDKHNKSIRLRGLYKNSQLENVTLLSCLNTNHTFIESVAYKPDKLKSCTNSPNQVFFTQIVSKIESMKTDSRLNGFLLILLYLLDHQVVNQQFALDELAKSLGNFYSSILTHQDIYNGIQAFLIQKSYDSNKSQLDFNLGKVIVDGVAGIANALISYKMFRTFNKQELELEKHTQKVGKIDKKIIQNQQFNQNQQLNQGNLVDQRDNQNQQLNQGNLVDQRELLNKERETLITNHNNKSLSWQMSMGAWYALPQTIGMVEQSIGGSVENAGLRRRIVAEKIQEYERLFSSNAQSVQQLRQDLASSFSGKGQEFLNSVIENIKSVIQVMEQVTNKKQY